MRTESQDNKQAVSQAIVYGGSMNTRWFGKECGNCHRHYEPYGAQLGQTCSHCGVRWTSLKFEER